MTKIISIRIGREKA